MKPGNRQFFIEMVPIHTKFLKTLRDKRKDIRLYSRAFLLISVGRLLFFKKKNKIIRLTF
jgi:hypothetical protein